MFRCLFDLEKFRNDKELNLIGASWIFGKSDTKYDGYMKDVRKTTPRACKIGKNGMDVDRASN